MSSFPFLKLDILRYYAGRWVNAFPRVKRISLHQYHGHKEPPAKYRYAVIFELELETEVQEKQEDGSLKVSSEAFDIFAYDYFDDDRFKMVYNYENIEPHYKNEWFFFPKYLNEKWPDFAPKEPCWQLFPAEAENRNDLQSDTPQEMSERPREADPHPLEVDAYIEMRRIEGAKTEIIAFELYDKKGLFKLTHHTIARKLIKDDGVFIQRTSWKQRGKRLVDKGKAMMDKI